MFCTTYEADKCKSNKVTKVNVIPLSVCDGYIGVPLRQGSYFHVNRIYLKGIISVLALSLEIYINNLGSPPFYQFI